MTIKNTLAERHVLYGNFLDESVIAMSLKGYLRLGPGWERLTSDQQNALDNICQKMARIINGDPNYIDNWHDIQGYARLIEDALRDTGTSLETETP